jgi:hypothetical protein
MKKLLFVLVLATIAFVSCKKEEGITPWPSTEFPDTTNMESISIYGEWKLLDGYMYVENLETGAKTRFSHFGVGKTISSLRYSGAYLDIETIEQNVTTWKFTKPNQIPGDGKFILNGDTTELYAFHVTLNNWTIIEDPTATISQMNLGGSSRPIRAFLDSYHDSIVKFYVQESYESIGGYNCKYFNELVFQKIGN